MNIRPNSGKVPVISKYASLTDVFSIFSNDLVYPDRVKWDIYNGLLRMCVSNPDSRRRILKLKFLHHSLIRIVVGQALCIVHVISIRMFH